MENRKREYRELSDDTKAKISNSSKGRPKSTLHKIHISQAMLDYWKTIPNKSSSDKISPTEMGQVI